jgi:hypothetical protein
MTQQSDCFSLRSFEQAAIRGGGDRRGVGRVGGGWEGEGVAELLYKEYSKIIVCTTSFVDSIMLKQAICSLSN